MPGIRRIVACLGACLFASPCFADDDTTAERISLSLTALYAAATAADSDRYFADHDISAYEHFQRSHSYNQPMAPLRFQRSDTFGRMIRIRSVSLLTLSENRSSRFFFGVNSDGFLGFTSAAPATGTSRSRACRGCRVKRAPHARAHSVTS